jgi:deoxycytidine triphosphate deaminase
VIEPKQDIRINPASIDLPIVGGELYATTVYFPGVNKNYLKRYASRRSYVENKPILEVEQTYLLPGPEVELPSYWYAVADGRSTAGRMGIFVELLQESERIPERTNYLPPGYKGRVWFRIEPQCFPIIISPGDALLQIRLRKVDDVGYLTTEDIRIRYGREIQLFDSENKLIPEEKIVQENSTVLHVDVSKFLKHIPFTSEPIEYRAEEKYEIADYWEVFTNEKRELIVPQKSLHLIQCEESVSVGTSVCAKMGMKTDELGIHVETHRAGFFDPGFSAPPTNEVINRWKPMVLAQGQYLTRLFWEDLSHPAANAYIGHYQGQKGPTPPKQFKKYKQLWQQIEEGTGIKPKKYERVSHFQDYSNLSLPRKGFLL